MAHILDDQVAIDVDGDHLRSWPGNGLQKLRDVRADDAVISVAFFDPHIKVGPDDPLGRTQGDGIVTQRTLDEWKSYGRLAGLRLDPSWWGWPEPAACAKMFSDQIARFDSPGKRRVDVVEYDVEAHNAVNWMPPHDYEVQLLLGYKLKDGTRVKGIRGCGGDYPDPSRPETLGWRWNRPFIYTFEGRQELSTAAADVVVKAGGKFGPQLYNGAMTEVWDMMREVVTWLRRAQLPVSMFMPYVDARRDCRPRGMRDVVLFATSRLTELYS